MSHPYTQQHWDVIVVGTGMGGGSVGRALAEAGKKVLFLEFGKTGFRSEVNGLSDTILPEARLARGMWPYPMSLTLNGAKSDVFAPIGAGLGGSSVFYAATLERPERHDLETTVQLEHPTGGWPVSFDEMAPWYDLAADKFKVYGTTDPLSEEPTPQLRQAPAFNTLETELVDEFEAAGLHPYHAHTAMAQGSAHDDCLGRKCALPDCKMDGRSAGVEPALATGNAFLLSEAKVVRLIGTASAVEGIEVDHGGERSTLTASQYVMAAGALGSPRLLLASHSEAWPNGACNESDLVGRNLMFHLNELFVVWPKVKGSNPKPTKAISIRDFYSQGDQRFGTFQAMGVKASYGEVHHYLSQMLAQSRLNSVPLARDALRIPAALAARLLGHAQVFVGLLEDMPYRDNRVTYSPEQPDHIKVEYEFQKELLQRRKSFLKNIWKGLKGMRRLPLALGPQLNLGHPSGTLRFGTSEKNSVFNSECRAHSIRNLWLADASFMPTSMGVNPSLTIAANALRVAHNITQSRET